MEDVLKEETAEMYRPCAPKMPINGLSSCRTRETAIEWNLGDQPPVPTHAHAGIPSTTGAGTRPQVHVLVYVPQ